MIDLSVGTAISSDLTMLPSGAVLPPSDSLISLNDPTVPRKIILDCRTTTGQLNGMRTLTIENDLLRAVLLLDKGGDIIELRHKPLDVDVMWHSPAGQRSPRETSMLLQGADTGFSDLYGGGWQDVLPVMGH